MEERKGGNEREGEEERGGKVRYGGASRRLEKSPPKTSPPPPPTQSLHGPKSYTSQFGIQFTLSISHLLMAVHVLGVLTSVHCTASFPS